MKIIHHDGYDATECMKMKDVICLNVLHAIRVLIDACDKLELSIEDNESPQIQAYCQELMELSDVSIVDDPIRILCETDGDNGDDSHSRSNNSGNSGSVSMSEKIDAVWRCATIQRVFQRRNEYQLSDSADYFLNQVRVIGARGYQPTRQDVLRSRVKTVGIVEADFTVKNVKFRMIDVGGYGLPWFVCNLLLLLLYF